MTGIARSVRRDIALVATFVVLLALVWVGRSGAEADALGGPTGIDLVYVTVGTNFPDALGVGPGAALNGAPVLLVPTNPPIPGVIATELERLDPKTVVIIGGEAAVSTAMEDAISDLLPGVTMERIAGTNRYSTNAQFSASVFPVEGFVSVGPSAFTADDPTDIVLQGTGTALSSPTNANMYAPITLPHGAEILEFTVYGYDDDTGNGGSAAGDDLEVQLWRVSLGHSDTFTCGTNSNGSGGIMIDTCSFGSTPVRVDNEHWHYQLVVKGADGNPDLRYVVIHYRVGDPNTSELPPP